MVSRRDESRLFFLRHGARYLPYQQASLGMIDFYVYLGKRVQVDWNFYPPKVWWESERSPVWSTYLGIELNPFPGALNAINHSAKKKEENGREAP